VFVFGKNIVAHTFGSAMGRELVVIESDIAAGRWLHHHFPHGVVFLVSLIAMAIWILYLVRQKFDEKVAIPALPGLAHFLAVWSPGSDDGAVQNSLRLQL
jgi:hypothetical protein